MFTIIDGNCARITGFDGLLDVPDMQVRHDKRAVRAVDPHPLVELTASWGVPGVTSRLAATLARDTVYMRERMTKQHERLAHNLRVDRIHDKLPIALHWISAVKPDRVRKVTEEHASSVLACLRRCLGEAVDAHLSERLAAARRVLHAAITPEVPKDATQAVGLGLKAMETRSRVASMPELDRLRLLHELGRQGNLEALAWIGDDPLRQAVCPPEVMRDALRSALDVRGGGWLMSAVDDAEEEAEVLAVTADLMLGGVSQALRDAGAPADMVQPEENYQSRVAAAIRQ